MDLDHPHVADPLPGLATASQSPSKRPPPQQAQQGPGGAGSGSSGGGDGEGLPPSEPPVGSPGSERRSRSAPQLSPTAATPGAAAEQEEQQQERQGALAGGAAGGLVQPGRRVSSAPVPVPARAPAGQADPVVDMAGSSSSEQSRGGSASWPGLRPSLRQAPAPGPEGARAGSADVAPQGAAARRPVKTVSFSPEAIEVLQGSQQQEEEHGQQQQRLLHGQASTAAAGAGSRSSLEAAPGAPAAGPEEGHPEGLQAAPVEVSPGSAEASPLTGTLLEDPLPPAPDGAREVSAGALAAAATAGTAQAKTEQGRAGEGPGEAAAAAVGGDIGNGREEWVAAENCAAVGAAVTQLEAPAPVRESGHIVGGVGLGSSISAEAAVLPRPPGSGHEDDLGAAQPALGRPIQVGDAGSKLCVAGSQKQGSQISFTSMAGPL